MTGHNPSPQGAENASTKNGWEFPNTTISELLQRVLAERNLQHNIDHSVSITADKTCVGASTVS